MREPPGDSVRDRMDAVGDGDRDGGGEATHRSATRTDVAAAVGAAQAASAGRTAESTRRRRRRSDERVECVDRRR